MRSNNSNSTYNKILVKDKISTCLSGNSRYAKCYSTQHMYRSYLNSIGLLTENGRIKKNKNKKYISYKDFSKILKTCNDLVTTEVVKGLVFKVPSSIGHILIKKTKFTPFALETLYNRKGILATSYTRDINYRLRIYWKKGDARRENFYESTLYKFRPCQKFKQKVTNQVNNTDLGTSTYNSIY